MPAFTFVVDDIIIETGQPVDRIIRQTQKTDCDMVVMGYRGQGVFEGTVLGSTSSRVSRRCKKPIMIVCLPEKDH